MTKLLQLYKYLSERKERFLDETFEDEIYSPVKPQFTIIDGGAYQGEFGFYCLPFAKTIYAFEPDPRPFNVMEGMVKKFELGGVIKTSNKALAGSIGKRFFHNSGYGGSTFFADSNDSIEVDTTTLATVIKENKLEVVDILKVDMENAEGEVFRASDFPEVADRIKLIIGEHLNESK